MRPLTCASGRQRLLWLATSNVSIARALMRIRLLAVSCLLAFLVIPCSAQSGATCADLHLVPVPREWKGGKSIAIGSAGIRVISEMNSADEFAAEDLAKDMKDRGIPAGKDNSAAARMVTIRLERLSNERAKELFEKPEEAYQIE